jgi:radical SAM superfamily enzyme YgiQ (UPF0313 family)
VKALFVYPRFQRHAEANPQLRELVPMNEYLGSPSLGIAALAAVTPPGWELEFRDDRLAPADGPTDADVVAFSFFTPAATRAFELARAFRAQGKKVVAGGIFPTLMPEETQPHFDAVVVGEGERSWPLLLADLAAGRLQPRYQNDAPIDCAELPLPQVSLYLAQERGDFHPDDYPVQLSRGCPLSCQACVLPISMTKKLRDLPLGHVLGQLEALGRAGKLACLTEDTSWLPGHPQRQLGALFDAMAARPEVARISYIGISMPMALQASPALLARARKAGVTMFYMVGGFDPITMKAFTGKDPKALQRAYDSIAKCFDAGIEPYTSFLLGNDDDDLGTADRMLEFAARAQIRKAEFAIFTPYPGTPAWHRLLAEGRILHRDWSRYNDANVVFQPKQMTPGELHAGYLHLWGEFYRGRHAELSALSQAERTIQF